ncbi:MAG: hypothetical protein A4E72_01919 [Syntrophus sp. PtaU1.Bin208]|nr:MAG: hypothetical protein A4E72_01919 [Syntrophus sp. PtaU1.Bin208]
MSLQILIRNFNDVPETSLLFFHVRQCLVLPAKLFFLLADTGIEFAHLFDHFRIRQLPGPCLRQPGFGGLASRQCL